MSNTAQNNVQDQSRRRLTDLAYCAVFAALIIALGFLVIPVGSAGIPIVLQNAAIIGAGLVLGPRRGFWTIVIFFALGLVLPVLAGGRTVLAALSGPSIGYLVGYFVSAVVAGAIAYTAPRGRDKTVQRVIVVIVAAFAGLLCQYVLGAIGLMFRAGMNMGAAAAAQLPFILPDSGKMVVMIIVTLAVHAAFPALRQPATRA